MRNKITMEISICQAENGFTLDELVKKVADSYEKKAFADILKMNLQLTQEVLMYRIFNDKSNMVELTVKTANFLPASTHSQRLGYLSDQLASQSLKSLRASASVRRS
jgi:hypothetical protein